MLSKVDVYLLCLARQLFVVLLEADAYLFCSTKQMITSHILEEDVYLLCPVK